MNKSTSLNLSKNKINDFLDIKINDIKIYKSNDTNENQAYTEF